MKHGVKDHVKHFNCSISLNGLYTNGLSLPPHPNVIFPPQPKVIYGHNVHKVLTPLSRDTSYMANPPLHIFFSENVFDNIDQMIHGVNVKINS